MGSCGPALESSSPRIFHEAAMSVFLVLCKGCSFLFPNTSGLSAHAGPSAWDFNLSPSADNPYSSSRLSSNGLLHEAFLMPPLAPLPHSVCHTHTACVSFPRPGIIGRGGSQVCRSKQMTEHHQLQVAHTLCGVLPQALSSEVHNSGENGRLGAGDGSSTTASICWKRVLGTS